MFWTKKKELSVLSLEELQKVTNLHTNLSASLSKRKFIGDNVQELNWLLKLPLS